ncbi:MAG TPA: peroxide stress protein YaaA, partial [Dermatophilaceae bacterium]
MLGVSANLLTDIAYNVRLDSAPAVPVGGLYTSVLYDALDLASMNSATHRRANRWLVIISALRGALRPTDRIPPYRLSMSVNFGMLGPLAYAPLTAVLPIAAGRGVILDCRSSTYTAAWALVLVFLIAITVVAEIADGAEVFDIAGHWAARAGHGRTWLLWLLI